MGMLVVCLVLFHPGHQHLKLRRGASPAAQWSSIRLPMQETRVQSLVWEDPTCHN